MKAELALAVRGALRFCGSVLDLDAQRTTTIPKDAATIILVRDGKSGLELFCVERSKASSFMGGAIVFPGGKVDKTDSEDAWVPLVTEPSPRGASFTYDAAHARTLSIAACRETLEEAALLPVIGGSISDDELLALRNELAQNPLALRQFLGKRSMKLALAEIHPFARWITPVAESRRFDARFFLGVAPPGQSGAHDAHETVKSFWATPAEVLRRYEAKEVQLMPPTHRTITLLASVKDTTAAIALANGNSLDPICPELVQQKDASGETLALTLPGDREHSVRESRVAGPSRYVLRGEQWRAEDAPYGDARSEAERDDVQGGVGGTKSP